MRTSDQRLLNAVQRPEAYEEVVIRSASSLIVLSVWRGQSTAPAVLFMPGTMTHPLFYEEFLDALNRAGLTVVGLHATAHGKSPRVRRRLTFPTLVCNAQDALVWLTTTFPNAPPVVLGSSQGGVLAMALATRVTGLAAVIAHNVLDPSLPDTLTVTRAPAWLRPAYTPLMTALRLGGRLTPGLPVPFDAYLDMERVSRDASFAERFYTDPLGRHSYPLGLLTGMLDEDIAQPVSCPVLVVAASGDPLFSLNYTRQVFARINAPAKELLVVDSDEHLIFNTAIDLVLSALLPRLRAMEPPTA